MSATPPVANIAEVQALLAALYPICRSITGDGVRETLRLLGGVAPIELHEVPSGTPALDWTVPDEWNVREAWIAGPDGRRVVDMRDSNLHLVGYSTPLRARMPLVDLRPHLHTLPDHPEWTPYRTSYYEQSWGFCLPHRLLESLEDGEYEVCIDSTLAPGSLSYGELVLPGAIDEEVLISAHVCHPSLANDNLSGIVAAVFLARSLAARSPSERRYTYRFLFAPGTIGALVWLATHREGVARICHGVTLQSLGDARHLTYKRTFHGRAEVDRAIEHVLRATGRPHEVVDFFPYGYDERQYNSPGFRLPVGALMRGRHGQFPEYHTSADNLEFVSAEQILAAVDVLAAAIAVIEGNRRFHSLVPHGEPQLGRRGLYRALGGGLDPAQAQMAMLWLLACGDGEYDYLAVAERAQLPFAVVLEAAGALRAHDLIEELPRAHGHG